MLDGNGIGIENGLENGNGLENLAAVGILRRCKGTRGGVLRRILGVSSPYLHGTVIGLVLSLVHAAAALLIPIFIGLAIDSIVAVGRVDFDVVFGYIIFIMLCIGVSCISQYFAGLSVASSTHSTVRDLRIALFTKLNLVPTSFIDSFPSGDIMARMSADTEQISDGLIHGTTNLFAGVLTALGTLVLMFSICWQLALMVMVLTPLSIFISYFIARSCRNKFMEQAALRGQLAGLAEEYVGNQKLVLSFGYGQRSIKKFDELNAKLKKTSTSATFFSSLTNPSARLINGIIYAAAVSIGALFITGGTTALTIGTLSTILVYAANYARPFNEITAVITELQTAFAGAKRVFEILDEPELTEDSHLPTLTQAKTQNVCDDGIAGDVGFFGVEFSYSPDVPLIEGFDLSVLAGQRVAIVGPTGSGKTTIINLLMRFYEPLAGRICVDGVDASSVRRSSIRSAFGMVLQESWLFEGTVRDNIAYGKPDASFDEIVEAAKNADIHSFIMRLENGYDTVITEGGGNISQGQMQLLCIARVMLHLPPMLILDEATSNIDTRTEAIIQSAFSKMMQGRTSFIIAHRLSTIKEADTILVLNQGKIIEQGTHQQLLEAKNFYSTLYNSQFS